jgi:hypothetical protein
MHAGALIGRDAEVEHDVASQVSAKLEGAPAAGRATVLGTLRALVETVWVGDARRCTACERLLAELSKVSCSSSTDPICRIRQHVTPAETATEKRWRRAATLRCTFVSNRPSFVGTPVGACRTEGFMHLADESAAFVSGGGGSGSGCGQPRHRPRGEREGISDCSHLTFGLLRIDGTDGLCSASECV